MYCRIIGEKLSKSSPFIFHSPIILHLCSKKIDDCLSNPPRLLSSEHLNMSSKPCQKVNWRKSLSTQSIHFETNTKFPTPLLSEKTQHLLMSSSSNKSANFPCILSRAAVEKLLGVYMNSYTQKCQPAKKFISEMKKGGLLASGGSWKSQEYTIRSLWYLILGKP